MTNTEAPDVDTILLAWHERQVTSHLAQLASVADRAGSAGERLEAVLTAYALISHRSQRSHRYHDAELVAFLHRDAGVAPAQQRLCNMILELVSEGAQTGDLRSDVAAEELTSYCLHALSAASSLPSESAVHRLVTVTLAGLHTSS